MLLKIIKALKILHMVFNLWLHCTVRSGKCQNSQRFVTDFFCYLIKFYVEVGANTLKSSAILQLPNNIMFSLKKTFVFEKMRQSFLGEQSTHIYNKICTNSNLKKQ